MYTEIYGKSTNEHLNDKEGVVDSLKGKLIDVVIAHEEITTFQKVKIDAENNNVFGIFTLQQIYVVDSNKTFLTNISTPNGGFFKVPGQPNIQPGFIIELNCENSCIQIENSKLHLPDTLNHIAKNNKITNISYNILM